MEEISENEKNSLSKKLLEFQRSGLISYGKYLQEQHEHASKKESKRAYQKYVEDQIKSNDLKIKKLDEKLQ